MFLCCPVDGLYFVVVGDDKERSQRCSICVAFVKHLWSIGWFISYHDYWEREGVGFVKKNGWMLCYGLMGEWRKVAGDSNNANIKCLSFECDG